jgi:flagella basal body P-ring formation protein FlgA
VVKRGELITVYSVAAGIQVKAAAKALADAALGDVITLESTETRKQFQGRVTAPQEAMVFVDSPKVAGEPAPARPTQVANQKTR